MFRFSKDERAYLWLSLIEYIESVTVRKSYSEGLLNLYFRGFIIY